MALSSQVSTGYPRVSRDYSLPEYGHFYSLSGYGQFSFLTSCYAVSIRRASSRILIAAFLSLSMILPHAQR